MASYPEIGLQYEVEHLNPPTLAVAESGVVRGIDLADSEAFRVAIVHPLATLAQRDTLWSFYETHKTADNTLVLDGHTYTLKFEAAYTERRVNASYFELSTTMVGSRS